MIQLRPKLLFALVLILSILVFTARTGSQSIDQKQADGPVFVDLGELFDRAPIKIEDVDLTKLPGLPRGYAALNNKAYLITTDAVAAGPYTVRFRAGSINDEETFKNLRIFHTEPDEFDPESVVWIDRTAGHPDAPEPDFRTRTIHARSDELYPGIYVIGRMVEKFPPSKAVTDLEIVVKHTREPVQLPENVRFVVTVKNNGPDVATNVGVKMDQSSVGGHLGSITPSQGTCKALRTGVYCKLGQLAAGSSITINVAFEPPPDFGGRAYESQMRVAGTEKDSNLDNNETTGSVLTIKDPNEPPVITLDGLGHDALFEQGEAIVLKATASDPDGSITKVEFFDNYAEPSLGVGTSTDAKHFALSVNGLKNGKHQLVAVATDNGGRTTITHPITIFVNGPIQVRIVQPKAGSPIKLGADFTLVAEATHPSGSIKTVEFFTVGISLGLSTPVEDNRFVLKLNSKWRGSFDIEAIATDGAGLVSKSAPVRFTVPIRDY